MCHGRSWRSGAANGSEGPPEAGSLTAKLCREPIRPPAELVVTCPGPAAPENAGTSRSRHPGAGPRSHRRPSAVESLHARSGPPAKPLQHSVALRGSIEPVIDPGRNARKKWRPTLPEQREDLGRVEIDVTRNAFEPPGAEPGVALSPEQRGAPLLLVPLERHGDARRILEPGGERDRILERQSR